MFIRLVASVVVAVVIIGVVTSVVVIVVVVGVVGIPSNGALKKRRRNRSTV